MTRRITLKARFGGLFAFEGLIPETLGNAPSLQALKAVLRITTPKGCFINYNVSSSAVFAYFPYCFGSRAKVIKAFITMKGGDIMKPPFTHFR